MKKLLLIAILMLALVFTAVACTTGSGDPETTPGETTVENPTAAPTDEPDDPTGAPTDPADDPTDAPTDPVDDPTDAPTDAPDVPTDAPTDAPTEAPTADPMEPVLVIDPEFIKEQALSAGGQTFTQEISSAEILTEGNRTFVRLVPDQAGIGDPYVTLIDIGSSYTLPQYMAIAYRTNSIHEGQFFMGSGAGWNGQGDVFAATWTEGDWGFQVINLAEVGLTSITDGLINYCRFDFFAGKAAEGDYFDVQYVAFFNSAEAAEAYDFKLNPPYIEADDAAAGKVAHSFDTFYVNGQMYFPEDGGAGDKLTALNNTLVFGSDMPHDSMILRGWIGFNQPMAELGYFIDNYDFVYGDFMKATEDGVKAAGGEHASRFEILVPMTALEGGTHTVGFVVRLEDGTVVRLRENLTVIIVPETVNEAADLATGHGAPFSGAPNNYFGQRFNIGDKLLKKISITEMATYADGGENTWTFKVWQWNTDYETTVAGTPLFETEGANHPDNTTFAMEIPSDKYITGDVYYEVTYVTGTGCFTGWTADNVAEGVETYVAGAKKDGSYASSIVVGTPATAAPEVIPDHQINNPPVYIVKAKDMLMTNPTQMTYTKEDGYIHFVPTGGDPNFMLFNGETGSRYAVIKYRTEYQANIQIFLGSTGAGPVDDTTMMEQALIPDGQWHLAIFDTQTLVDRGVYDGSTAAFLRLDVMESGYECDENGEPIRDPDGTWHKLPLPEGSTIDIAYFAFFETEEKANAFEYAPVVTDKTVYNVGEPIMISATGAGKDWVGIAAVDATETLRWWYVADVGEGVAINALDNAAIQAGTGDATGNLPAGDYYVVWVPNDQSMNGAEGLCRYPITIVDPDAEPEDPDAPAGETLVIPQDQWVISGHMTHIVYPDQEGHGPMITAGGVESAALLHQGSIALGEIDLSKYSKVIIYWGSDNGPGTQDLYAKNEHNRFALVNADKNMQMSPNEDTIIVAKTYELHGWAIAPFEIDLTGIDYNGPVFLTHDSLAGGFALVYSIEFVA